ncbi:MAG: acyltransferase family protein [Sporolactobacillus sp.]
MSKTRDSYFDNVKFFLILLVVFGHSLTNLKSNIPVIYSLYTFIFIFHMPAFILISGYFSKHFNKPGYVKNVVKKTLIPYMFFQAIYSVFYYWTGYEKNFRIDWVSPHWTLWFLVSMLFWKMLIIPFSKLGKLGFPISIFLALAAGCFDTVGSDFSFSRTLAFFPFFYLGYLLKRKHFALLLNHPIYKLSGMGILAAVFLACHFLFPKDLQEWVKFDTSYHGVGLSLIDGSIARLSVYALSILTIFSFMVLIPRLHFVFTSLGKNTLYIYLLHGFFIKTVVLLPIYDRIQNLYQYSFLLAGSLSLCYFLASRPVRLFTRPLIEIKMPHWKSI